MLCDKAKNIGYKFSSTNIPYSNTDKNIYDFFIPLWDSQWDYLKPKLNIGNLREQGYSLLWQNAIFFSSPLFVKPKIYNNGGWMFTKEDDNENTKPAQHYNFLRTLPYISDVSGSKPGFVFIWSNAPHFPWDIVDDNGTFIPDVTPYKNNKWSLSKVALWIDWMKQKNIYNNTKIIILSDHGIRHAKDKDSAMVTNPFIPKTFNDIPVNDLLNFTPLMMVKDYNAKGKIKEDWRFLSNADTYSIAFDENDPTKANPPLERILNAYKVSWKVKVNQKEIPIDRSYKVKENIFILDNWKEIK